MYTKEGRADMRFTAHGYWSLNSTFALPLSAAFKSRDHCKLQRPLALSVFKRRNSEKGDWCTVQSVQCCHL